MGLMQLRCSYSSHSRIWTAQQAGKSHRVMQQQALLPELQPQTQAEVATSGTVKGALPAIPWLGKTASTARRSSLSFRCKQDVVQQNLLLRTSA